VISTTESRIPFIPDDPNADLDYVTLTTLNNLLYAQALGAQYTFTVLIDDPDLTTPGLETHGIPPDELHKGTYCMHPKWGIRPAQFCRMPVLWDIFRQDPTVEYLVHIDSDALFRSANLSVQRHFDELSESQPIGFMNNGPWQPHTPCSGYYVMRRGRDRDQGNASEPTGFWGWRRKKSAPRTIVTDFLRLWWDQDWHLNMCAGELKDQCTLWTLLKYDLGLKNVPGEAAALFRRRGVVFFPEEQFHKVGEDQIILHRHHKIADRYDALLREWSWPEYPVNNNPEDRQRLRKLLAAVDFRKANASEIALDMWEIEGYHTQWRDY